MRIQSEMIGMENEDDLHHEYNEYGRKWLVCVIEVNYALICIKKKEINSFACFITSKWFHQRHFPYSKSETNFEFHVLRN